VGDGTAGPPVANTIPSVTLADIRAARETLAGVVRTTPIEGSSVLEAAVGGPVWLKCENLQRAGSFKIRGAYTRMSRLTPEERAAGVVAASAGNHAQGVALGARLLGIAATVYMPIGAAIPKEHATRGYGAHVKLVGATVDESLELARAHAAETGAVLIHPFDHPDVVAGQGTIGLEILDQVPDVRTVVASVGGGGLLAGISVAVRSLRPDVRIVGVQAAGAAAYPGSLAAGHPVPLTSMATMADGIAILRPGAVPFELIKQYADDVVTVSEDRISEGLLLSLERAKQVIEPAAAAAVAAVLDHPDRFPPPVVIVLSGGNIDPLLLMRVLRHGMAAAGRYLAFRVRIPDQPGALARLLADLARLDANVLDVVHERTGARLHVDEVEVRLQLETRGAEHRTEVIDTLKQHGYPLQLA
jgi:threonine dehydratase